MEFKSRHAYVFAQSVHQRSITRQSYKHASPHSSWLYTLRTLPLGEHTQLMPSAKIEETDLGLFLCLCYKLR